MYYSFSYSFHWAEFGGDDQRVEQKAGRWGGKGAGSEEPCEHHTSIITFCFSGIWWRDTHALGGDRGDQYSIFAALFYARIRSENCIYSVTLFSAERLIKTPGI